MTTIIPQFINNKVIFLSVIIAIILHGSLIIFINLITIDTKEEIEPKIILELMNDVLDDIKPVINEIKPPQIIEPQEIIKPAIIKPQEKLLDKIKNNITLNDNPNTIVMPIDLKPLINNKVDIPKPIKKNNTDLTTSELPNIIQPKQIKKNQKPLKDFIIPNLPEQQEFQTINRAIPKIQKLPKKPIQNLDKINSLQNEIKKSISSEDTSELNTYKNKIRNIIQSFAINNYPAKEKRRKIGGIVNIIFKLRLDGSIEYVKSGPNTNASEALIKAAIASVKKSAPFNKSALLEIKNEFSINIIYKINR
ncbi:energy transducer TonB [Alphaproteobacteria bacterium]|nr:energy transducer TonB [Alphaproteobacteria bacterium]